MHPMSPGLLMGLIKFLIDVRKGSWPLGDLREVLSNLRQTKWVSFSYRCPLVIQFGVCDMSLAGSLRKPHRLEYALLQGITFVPEEW